MNYIFTNMLIYINIQIFIKKEKKKVFFNYQFTN